MTTEKRHCIVMANTNDGVAWALYNDNPLRGGRLIAFKTGFATRPEAHRDGQIFYHMMMEYND